jgi:hypothetical protein
MLSDDIELVSSNDFYNGRVDGDMGEAWERIKRFCEEALKPSPNNARAKPCATCRPGDITDCDDCLHRDTLGDHYVPRTASPVA